VQWTAPDGSTTVATLVVPEGEGPFSGVLFGHWYAPARGGDRTEFLPEALTLAERGVASLLPQGNFPWIETPSGFAEDCDRVVDQVRDLRAALSALQAVPGVRADRLGYVGHDYGAMYGTVLAAADARVRTAVLMTPSATFSEWFNQYWLRLPTDQQATYRAAFAALDPLTLAPAIRKPVLLQFGEDDIFITPSSARQLAAAFPQAETRFYQAGHELDEAASQERSAWLNERL